MKIKGTIAIGFILSLFLSVYYIAHFHVTAYRSNYKYRLHSAISPLPEPVVDILAGEFKGMVANYLLLEAAGFIGSNEKASDRDWAVVAQLLDQSNKLDPYFKQTYRLAQATLPWEAGKTEEAIAILERSRKHLTWDWEPGFYIGFDYYFFLKDNLTASQKLMETSEVPGAPLALATLASRLASRSGNTRAAIDFLITIFEKTEDIEKREVLGKRILALKGVDALEAAIDLFKNKYGRMPKHLEELVELGILAELPVNPYERDYSFKNGHVEF